MRLWPVLIVCFFGVVFVMNFALVYLAQSNSPELEVSYTHGGER